MSDSTSEPGLEPVSRRLFLRKGIVLGGVTVALGPAFLAACGGTSDAEVFARGATTDPTASSAATTPSTGAPTTTAAAAAKGLSAASELAISFAYTASGGNVKNPYIAVWVEDASGAMVDTVELWLQSGKGERWWNELRRWNSQESARVGSGGVPTVQTLTGATRRPGSYDVAWNCSHYDGTKCAPGTYFLCLEASREKGPYGLIREQIDLGTTPFVRTLTPNGELTSAKVAYRV